MQPTRFHSMLKTYVLCSLTTCFTFSLIINTSSLSPPRNQADTFIRSDNCPHLDAAFDSNYQTTSSSYTSIHLITLPKVSTDNTLLNILRWKQAALGDGGVYWDQRPKSLTALNFAVAEHIFRRLSSQREQNCTELCNSTVECAVISTCARFEILLSVQTQETTFEPSTSKITPMEYRNRAIVQAVAECLAVQVIELNWFRRISWLTRLDDPKRISSDAYSRWINNTNAEGLHGGAMHRLRHLTMLKSIKEGRKSRYQKRLSSLTKDISSILLHRDGVLLVCRHLSRLAAGFENSVGVFRPFSARDSHVMHQLKRSAAGAIGLTGDYVSPNQLTFPKSVKYVKLIFDSALHAGKAARSPKHVPILDQLREAMRMSSLMTTKEDQAILDGLTIEAEQQALLSAVEPTVQNCLSRFIAMENSKSLSQKYKKNTGNL